MTTFKPELIDEIVAGRKRQTRRPVKYGEVPVMKKTPQDLHGREIAEIRQNGRLKYAVGRDYAIQPGRGRPCAVWKPQQNEWIPAGNVRADFHHAAGYRPLRYRITEIRREDVRNISHPDAVDEGFSIGRVGFWRVWCSFYDPQSMLMLEEDDLLDHKYKERLMSRPDDLYQAWALTFELC